MKEPTRRALTLLITAPLLLPFAVILWRVSYVGIPLGREIGAVFALTILQAAASACATLAVGILGGLGLLWLGARTSPARARWVEAIALLPNAAPVLILLLAVIKFFPWARGLAGIIFVHVLLNAGLVAVAFAHLTQAKIAGLAELAYVEGASGPDFFRKGAWPLLRGDLALLFLFVFAICFTSFAVPLAIGGSQATTVEVLIYQKIRISGDWSHALGLALMQMAAVFGLTVLLRRGESAALVGKSVPTPLLQWKYGLAFAFLPAVLILAGLLDGWRDGFDQARARFGELPELLAGSTVIGFTTGFAMMAALLALAYVRPAGWFRRFLVGYAAPSSVLTGFALLIVWRTLGLASYFKIATGLALIALPSFYRYEWDSVLRSLEGQIAVARTLGADARLIFTRVVFPQTIRPACFIGGLSALWAWGDFALSGVVAERNLSVAQVAHGMMESYRLDAATIFVWILIAGGLLTFAIFAGAGHVLGSKS